MMEKRGAKLKSWAGAFSAFDEDEDEGVRKHRNRRFRYSRRVCEAGVFERRETGGFWRG